MLISSEMGRGSLWFYDRAEKEAKKYSIEAHKYILIILELRFLISAIADFSFEFRLCPILP